MLPNIRRNLTTLYTRVFGLFLLAFIAIVCLGIIWGIYVDITDEIRVLAREVVREQREVIVQHFQTANIPPQETPIENDYDISGQVFYYLFDRNGQLIKVDLPIPILRDIAEEQVIHWDSSKSTKIAVVALPTGGTAMLAFAQQKIYHNDTTLGTVYVGRDVTAYARVLVHGIFTLIGVAVLFLILAAVIGSFLAGKVTLPIEQSIIRQKQFVADASHELRNPLSVLLSSIEAIEMDSDSTLSPFAMQIIVDAQDEFFRLERIVNDLLTLARADTDEIKAKREQFSLNLVADQVLRSFVSVVKYKKITIKFDVTRTVEMVADPERIHQLLYILIDNAIKYSSHGGEVQIYFDQVQHGSTLYTEIVVGDTGPGIPVNLQKKIFQRFFRVDQTRLNNIEGAGLGLSIAKWIVDIHHGRINVDSEPGKGSRFVILIPDA
ncbi:cell wall metabolism sensor histidine kinase WalK [Sporomusa sp. KB1]|jgi:signal transduction histidine kinase|uniref:sensor histidine kinase n=1 Tax=Sporomusa sp. KB1 TaxID=943346 RepID=UPI00119D6EF1|nr:HAMP domain-containing sensor histidine kinase [Sporomusa sp. KB1]TWH45104.1 phospho-acceptor domain-containing protein [Sporomusa sp. KB1]